MPKPILIVDDDHTLVALMKEGLESAGYEVAAAFDGQEGVRRAGEIFPSAIILDYHMPGGGGQTAYERLRAAAPTKATPIIFSTVISLEEIKRKVGGSPNTFFLRKPVGLTQVIAVLNFVLGEQKKAPGASALPFQPFVSLSEQDADPLRAAATLPARSAPKHHEFEVRVTYADTDKLGIIYYANYLKYFEQGRTELLRSLGVRYRDLEIQRKIFLPAIETGCRYLSPSRYDDLLVVRTWISSLGLASVRFENEIFDKDMGGKKVAEGFSRHALVNDLWRNVRIPEDLRRLLTPYVALGIGQGRGVQRLRQG